MTTTKTVYIVEYTVIILLWTLAVISPLIFMTDFNEDWPHRGRHQGWQV